MECQKCSDDDMECLLRTRPINLSNVLLLTSSTNLPFPLLVDLTFHKAAALGIMPMPQLAPSPKRSKLLVCHDLRGNYLNDASNQGDRFGNSFQITDWNLIDIFCYFSHNLISIPPAQWINCCHRNGVQVMGTFLTEWDAGRQACKQLFASEETAKRLSELLVSLAEMYKIDGWLINIENCLDADVEVPVVCGFLRRLSAAMHDLHGESSAVLWYDAVTGKGELRWQNRLNGANKQFFDCCDGIFLNYGWNHDTPAVSALFAGMSRRFDVYFGIDVWGRGTYGGGKYSCDKALCVIRQFGASAALFAPGYVLECEVDEALEALHVQEEILTKTRHFWGLIRSVWHQRRLCSRAMPFVVNVSQAAGSGVFVEGTRQSHVAVGDSASWYYDLSMQGEDCSIVDRLTSDGIEAQLDYSDAFNGNCSLRLTATQPTYAPMGTCTVESQADGSPSVVTVTVAVRSESEGTTLVGVFAQVSGGAAMVHSTEYELLDCTGSASRWEVRRYRLEPLTDEMTTTGKVASIFGVHLRPGGKVATSTQCSIGMFTCSYGAEEATLTAEIQDAFLSSRWLSFALHTTTTSLLRHDVFACVSEWLLEELLSQVQQPETRTTLGDVIAERIASLREAAATTLGSRLHVFSVSCPVDLTAVEMTMTNHALTNDCRISLELDSPLFIERSICNSQVELGECRFLVLLHYSSPPDRLRHFSIVVLQNL